MKCPPHPAEKAELRKRRGMGPGGWVYALQCQVCGRASSANIDPVKLAERGVEVRLVPLWNTYIPNAKPNRSPKRRAYEQRLRSKSWKQLRRQVLERDRWTCVDCGLPASEVAHKSYESFGQETAEDLKASCRDCNQDEREKRITRRVLGGA